VGLSQISNIKYQIPNIKWQMADGKWQISNQQINESADLGRLSGFPFSRFVEWLVVLIFVIIGLVTARDYFGRWAQLPDLYMAYDVYALELIEHMASERDPSVAYVIPMDSRAGHEARHYTLDFLYRGDTPYYYVPVDETTVTERLTEVASGRETLRVVRWLRDKHTGADEREVVTFLLARAARRGADEIFPVYRIETWSLPSTETVFTLPTIKGDVGATFDGVLRLEAADLSLVGDRVDVAIRWAPLAAMDADYKASLRLVGEDGGVVAQKDRFLRHNWHQGTSLWPPETVNEYYLLPSVPPGEYEVRAVVYHPETLAPLMTDAGAEVSLGRVRVE
jgi:hypothetical protein